ncbi:MAG: type IX secretion system sortase PorU [Tannerella sp.]|nr:type IX secretion system sortase PorU [Tannerella sp.]
MLRTFFTILTLIFTTVTAMADGSVYAPKSALSEGKWVKISVNETGFYKLTYSELKKMGFSDPAKVSIHGYGGWPMEEDFLKAEYIDDLPSAPVYRGGDYLLFYGKGTVKWTYDANRKSFVHENNAYATKGYYFVTDATTPAEVTTMPSEGSAGLRIETYDDYFVHEIDKVSLTTSGRPNSGRELFGESFDATGSSFKFNIPGITNDDGKISYRFVAKIRSGSGKVILSIANGEEYESPYLNQDNYIYTAATSVAPQIDWIGEKHEETTISMRFTLSGQTSHLDYLRLQVKRLLQPYGACALVRSLESVDKSSQFVIKNASQDILVFDVTEGKPVQLIETALSGTEATFSISAGAMREFAIVDKSKQFPTPETEGEIENQDLHGMAQTDMIILSPKAFVREAERLAEIHRKYDNLSVSVVTPEQVYNEFSSGGAEATAIRRFMKMFYDRSTSDDDAPKYLLLFGDGRFDNRKLTDIWKNSSDNYIVTYQSKETLAENSYVSDDYFGLLADNEGADPVRATIYLGIGRFPVNTLTQAKNAVDKVISYIENTKSGAWKNKICFVADDGNNTDEHDTIHAAQADILANYIEENHPEYIPVKLYFDAFKIDFTGGKPSFPDIRTNLQKALKEGVLVLNYTGHGDAVSWSEEKVMTQTDITSFTYQNLPLWITASCDFAPYDAPSTSAGEDVFLNPKSGGIALFTTARVAYSDANMMINQLFINNLFKKIDGRHLTLGEVMKYSKNDYQSERLKSFLLIGDPAMRLAYPDDFGIETTEINGMSVNDASINFKAFEEITVKGKVTDSEGRKIDDFNGLLSATVFDSRTQVECLDNTNSGRKITYYDYPNKLYVGNDYVRNGEFAFTFTVPKDISYSNKTGKISLYASDEDNGIEANGSFKKFTIGGTADNFETDTIGPEIRAIYLNTGDFNEGDRVNTTPVFAAIVWDGSGINTGGSSIGHNITLTIDDSPMKTYTLDSYYETYLDGNEGEGIVRFPVPTLEAGTHKAQFKVWDIFNNSSSRTFEFVVADNYKPSIVGLTAGPNPALEYVNFMISHNVPESSLKVEIQVFDIVGRLVWNHIETGSSSMFENYSVRWDLTNGAGARLRPGAYFYRAIISSGNSQESSKSNKLIIFAQ